MTCYDVKCPHYWKMAVVTWHFPQNVGSEQVVLSLSALDPIFSLSQYSPYLSSTSCLEESKHYWTAAAAFEQVVLLQQVFFFQLTLDLILMVSCKEYSWPHKQTTTLQVCETHAYYNRRYIFHYLVCTKGARGTLIPFHPNYRIYSSLTDF